MLKELKKKVSRLEKLASERIQENKICNCKAKSQKDLSREFLDEVLIQWLVNPKVGDLAIVKLLELAYKLIGAIQSARTQFNNQNNVATAAVASNTMYGAFKAGWRIRKDIEMSQRAEQEEGKLTDGNNLPNG